MGGRPSRVNPIEGSSRFERFGGRTRRERGEGKCSPERRVVPRPSVDPGRAVPDYLPTQLEFLAALRFIQENTSDAETAASAARAKSDFLERHLLNWVPAAAGKLDRTEAPGFPVLMTMLTRFLRREGGTPDRA